MAIDFEQLQAVARGFSRRFPEGHDPFRMMTRLLEECGELAEQVNHFEGSGVKREKHGEPDRAKLGHELCDVLTCVARIIDYYHAENEVEASLAWIYQRLTNEGFIPDKP
jgi:NTP pyrophosphatase (non-canonical NTP hydrolase)